MWPLPKERYPFLLHLTNLQLQENSFQYSTLQLLYVATSFPFFFLQNKLLTINLIPASITFANFTSSRIRDSVFLLNPRDF